MFVCKGKIKGKSPSHTMVNFRDEPKMSVPRIIFKFFHFIFVNLINIDDGVKWFLTTKSMLNMIFCLSSKHVKNITTQKLAYGIMKDNWHCYTFSGKAVFDIRSCFSARICKKIYWERHFRLNSTIDCSA